MEGLNAQLYADCIPKGVPVAASPTGAGLSLLMPLFIPITTTTCASDVYSYDHAQVWFRHMDLCFGHVRPGDRYTACPHARLQSKKEGRIQALVWPQPHWVSMGEIYTHRGSQKAQAPDVHECAVCCTVSKTAFDVLAMTTSAQKAAGVDCGISKLCLSHVMQAV